MSALLTLLLAPSVFLLAIPLAFFASVTTTLAFTTLLLRVLLIYIELFTSILMQQLRSFGQVDNPTTLQNQTRPTLGLQRKRSSRSTLTASSLSSGSLTPKHPSFSQAYALQSQFYNSTATIAILSPPVNPIRDYEGVGGWRIQDHTSDSDSDTQPWTRMNERLELPAQSITNYHHHHRRSLTGGSISPLATEKDSSKRRSGGPYTLTPSTSVLGPSPVHSRSGKSSGTVSPEVQTREQGVGKRAKSMIALGRAAIGMGGGSGNGHGHGHGNGNGNEKREHGANVGRSRALGMKSGANTSTTGGGKTKKQKTTKRDDDVVAATAGTGPPTASVGDGHTNTTKVKERMKLGKRKSSTSSTGGSERTVQGL